MDIFGVNTILGNFLVISMILGSFFRSKYRMRIFWGMLKFQILFLGMPDMPDTIEGIQ